MTEGTNTKYMLTDALGSVTCVYDAVIAGLKAGVCPRPETFAGMMAKKGETR